MVSPALVNNKEVMPVKGLEASFKLTNRSLRIFVVRFGHGVVSLEAFFSLVCLREVVLLVLVARVGARHFVELILGEVPACARLLCRSPDHLSNLKLF